MIILSDGPALANTDAIVAPPWRAYASSKAKAMCIGILIFIGLQYLPGARPPTGHRFFSKRS
jgi:hypothetical protein